MIMHHSDNIQLTRRDWLAAACLAMGLGHNTQSNTLAAVAEESCRLAMGTYGLQTLSLDKAIRLIDQTGFDGLEITVMPNFTGDPGKLSLNDRKKLRGQIESSGLRLEALMADIHPQPDDKRHQKQLDQLKATLKLARDLTIAGATPLVQTVLGGRDKGQGVPGFFVTRLKDWKNLAEEYQVQIAIKPHRSHTISRPSQAVAVLKELGDSNLLKMVYDYSHYAFRSLTIQNTIKESLPWTTYIAVKDAVQQKGRTQFKLPGTTKSWDQADVIKGFYNGGYRGAFCCEVSSQLWKQKGYDPVEATQTSYRAMAEAFRRAKVSRQGKE